MFSKKSFEWYRNKTAGITQKAAQDSMLTRILLKGKRAPLLVPGTMYTFLYDAKMKDVLPYWDKFPLVLIVEPYEDGFLGLNLHYIPPSFRYKILQQLSRLNTDTKYDNKTRIRLSWELLKTATRIKFVRRCIKRYLDDHRRSKMVKIPYNEWPHVIMLPSQRFTGATPKQVWADSLGKE